MDIINNKIKTPERIEQICNKLKSVGETIVTTNGSFDILHAAHIHLLEKAKAEGDCLIVLLNSDSSIKRNKGENRPIVNETERAYMLASLSCVDYVIIFGEDKPLEILKRIKPDCHVKGGSFIDDRINEERKLVESWKGRYKTFPLEEDYSTTKIIDDILRKYGK